MNVKAKQLSKKARKSKGYVHATGAVGQVSYKKMSGSKKLSINAKTGQIKVRKGTKKGTYRIRVRVSAAGNSNYRAGTVVSTVVVHVK
jgi:endo-1,4-beta-xylanase